MSSQKAVKAQESDLCHVELTLTEIALISKLIKLSEYQAIVNSIDASDRRQLLQIQDKLDSI